MSTDKPFDARSWTRALGLLMASTMPAAEAKERLAVFGPMLEHEFDGRIFNRDSLAFVARKLKFFPTFHELCAALVEWRQTAPPPRHSAIEDRTTDELGPESRSWLAYYRKQEAAGFPRGREHAHSLLRRYAPGAAVLVGGYP